MQENIVHLLAQLYFLFYKADNDLEYKYGKNYHSQHIDPGLKVLRKN